MSTDSNLPPEPPDSEEIIPAASAASDGIEMSAKRLIETPIEDELKDSYLVYSMSVIVSRALPDVRDGLKPSQRRILVAMNDLNLTPGAGRVKCAKISGDTSGNYHPHGESVIYPTLVRMAQEWNMRHVLVDKQGNFGSIAGLPAAAMRYTEARMSAIAALMMEDIKLDTVDYVPTYDERRTEPTGAALEVSKSARERRQRHRGGHGHVDPAAQSGRNLRRLDSRDRRAERVDRRTAGDCARPRFSHRRHHLRPLGHPPRLSQRTEHRRRPREGCHRGARQTASDRHHGNPLPAGPRPRRGTHRRAGERGQNRRHLRHPQRKRLERAGPAGLRPETRRRSRHRSESALSVLAAARHLLAELPGAGRRQAADPFVQGTAARVPPPPRDGDPPADAISAGPRQAAKTHGRGLAAGPRQHRRGDPRHPKLLDPDRGERAADENPNALGLVAPGAGRRRVRRPGRRARRRRSSTR